MKIILDIDNVILNNAKAYFDFVYKKTGYQYDYHDMKYWGFHHIMPDIPKENSLRLLREMHSSEALGDMSLIEGALDTIKKIKKQGDQIYLISSCIPNETIEYSKQIRIKQLNKIFGENFFTKIHLLLMDEIGSSDGNKTDILKLYSGDNSIFLDDSVTNLTQAKEVGIKHCFLFSAPWNIYEKDFKKVYKWSDFYKELMIIKQKL